MCGKMVVDPDAGHGADTYVVVHYDPATSEVAVLSAIASELISSSEEQRSLIQESDVPRARGRRRQRAPRPATTAPRVRNRM